MSKTEETLGRLMSEGKCDCLNIKEYTVQLKQLAEKEANRENAKKRGRFFKALGDESRQRILSLLSIKELCVCELVMALNMTQPTTSHHLKILEDADLIQDRRDGKWMFYSVKDKAKVSSLIHLSQ
jgi:ArsR family transcriptional regulator